MKIATLLLTAVPMFAAVDGVAINGSTGKPQAGVSINLVQPGQNGMQALGQATSGADGAFRIDKDIPPGPALLQNTYSGVTYTQAIPPGSATSGIKVNVFESTAEPPAEMTTEHLVLIEPSATELRVAETFFTRNKSKLTYQDSANGSIRLYLPAGAPADLKVTINSTGVPIQRPLEKGKPSGSYKISYPLKPGETRMDLEYTLPASATFSSKVFSNEPPAKLVVPGTVTLSGTGITDLGQEEQTKARVYTFKGNAFKAEIMGVGSIRGPETPPVPSAEESGAPKCCEEAPARVDTQKYGVLGLTLAILLVGGTLLFRKGTA
jgi:hypothetical protein